MRKKIITTLVVLTFIVAYVGAFIVFWTDSAERQSIKDKAASEKVQRDALRDSLEIEYLKSQITKNTTP